MYWLAIYVLVLAGISAAAENWPMYRGSGAAGVSVTEAPLEWNADSSSGPARNIKWKTPVPGLSHSSPIVWNNMICVTTAVSAAGEAPLKVGLYGAGDPAKDDGEQSWDVLCFDRTTGKSLWQRSAWKGKPRTRRHTKATHANSTLATDGKRLIAWFGSEGVFAFDLQGKPLWSKNLGSFDVGPQGYDLQWGTASSPVLHDGKVILQCDQKRGSFLVVLDAANGKEVWRTDRDGVSNHSWATPAVVTAGGGSTQIVCNGWPYIAGYDLTTGKELWRLKSGGDIPVPTPVTANGLIYITNAHGGGAPLYAVRPDARGDITLAKDQTANAAVAWFEPRNGAYMQTPLIHGGLVYSCSDRGVLKVFDAETGKLQYTQRLGEGNIGFSSSPVAAGDRIYFANEDGEVFVIAAGRSFRQLAHNRMGEIVMASPAAVGGHLFYRTRGHLVAIASGQAVK